MQQAGLAGTGQALLGYLAGIELMKRRVVAALKNNIHWPAGPLHPITRAWAVPAACRPACTTASRSATTARRQVRGSPAACWHTSLSMLAHSLPRPLSPPPPAQYGQPPGALAPQQAVHRVSQLTADDTIAFCSQRPSPLCNVAAPATVQTPTTPPLRRSGSSWGSRWVP